MDHNDIQARRSANQRRILLELIQALPALEKLGKNFSRNLNRHFREHSQFGSRDRRLYRELIHTYLRYQPWLEALSDSPNEFLDTLISLATPTPDIAKLYSTIDPPLPVDSPETARHRLIGRSDKELSSLIPSWFSSHLNRELDVEDLLALFSRPPLWIRVQKGDRESIAAHLNAAYSLSKANCFSAASITSVSFVWRIRYGWRRQVPEPEQGASTRTPSKRLPVGICLTTEML